MCQNADIGPVRPEGHPRTFVRPVAGGDLGLVTVLEAKLGRLTERVPTIQIEHLPVSWVMPRDKASHRSSITAVYSATLLGA